MSVGKLFHNRAPAVAKVSNSCTLWQADIQLMGQWWPQMSPGHHVSNYPRSAAIHWAIYDCRQLVYWTCLGAVAGKLGGQVRVFTFCCLMWNSRLVVKAENQEISISPGTDEVSEPQSDEVTSRSTLKDADKGHRQGQVVLTERQIMDTFRQYSLCFTF